MSEEKKPTSRHYLRMAGASLGVLVAGATAGVFAERAVVTRRRRNAEVPFGSLVGEAHTVTANDGVELYAEVDPVDGAETGRSGLSVVFVHGFCLSLQSWHFQRQLMREQGVRSVYYDHRSHGRSERGTPENATIDQLGRDLGLVVEKLSADGPVVIVAHSMGGMATMALAEQYPDWFGDRIVGVALLNTSSGGLSSEAMGLPGVPGRVVDRFAPSVIQRLGRHGAAMERVRRLSSDFMFAATRRLAFGGPVPDEYVDFLDDLIARTPFDVVAEFFTQFDLYDKHDALRVLSAVPTLILGGQADRFTPVLHSRRMAADIGRSTLVELEQTGHVAMIERHDEVNQALVHLLDQVAESPRA